MNPRLLTISAIAVAAAIGACKDGQDPTGPDSFFTAVVITPSTGNVAIGSTILLRAAISGPPGTPQGVTWKSVDTAIASVDDDGLVLGLAAGTARIRATWVEDSTNFTDAYINVTASPVVDTGAPGRAIIRRR